jgi:H+-transporting ATPase
MEVAAIVSIALLDYADFALILALLLVNATISYVEESNADTAIKVRTATRITSPSPSHSSTITHARPL